MQTLFVIDPRTRTISQDTLIREEDGIQTFARIGSVGEGLAFQTEAEAQRAAEEMIREDEEEQADADRTTALHSGFRAAVERFRAREGK